VLKALQKGNFPVQILGNPRGLEKEISFLKKVKIRGYQLSLDGLENRHDEIRGKDSWNETIRAINLLNKNNIPVNVMFTLSKYNFQDLKPLMSYCAKIGVSRFSFDRLVPIGSAKNWGQYLPSPQEYKNILFDIFWRRIYLQRKGYLTRFVLKDRLWRLLYHDLGIFRPKKTSKIISGCLVGINSLAILADGSVVPCRRLPLKIGELPEQEIDEIFFSEKMNELREYQSIENCGECELLAYCRGNRCVAYGVYGDYFAPDPQCWRYEK
jgi:radical SAM protein with 4Fe4S-binding SPASM domain